MRGFICIVACMGAGLIGCSKGKSTGAEPAGEAPDGLNGRRAEVSSGQVVSGFKHGTLRKEIDVAAFAISKNPITVEQFQVCIDDGPCASPEASCSNSEDHAQDAALCVGVDNARAYCAWSGGRLASLSEWFLAARGHSPQRFSWGEGAPTCKQHPLARVPLKDRVGGIDRVRDDDGDKTECGESRELLLRVGGHVAGKSPSGLEDVLLTPGELVMGDPESNFGVCRGEEKDCLVYGLIPGAIDSVKRASDSDQDQAYAFRCVWSDEEE